MMMAILPHGMMMATGECEGKNEGGGSSVLGLLSKKHRLTCLSIASTTRCPAVAVRKGGAMRAAGGLLRKRAGAGVRRSCGVRAPGRPV
jgi:hypothetical protein